jgi:hypothetical protein
MKTTTYVILALAVLLGSCAYADSADSIEETLFFVNRPLSYEIRVFDDAANSQSTIRIEYPAFTDIEYSSWINGIIFPKLLWHAAAHYVRDGFDSVINIDLTSKVTLNNGRFISIVFWGKTRYFVHESERNGTLVDTINIDVLAQREVTLNDMFTIDSEFVDTYYAKAYHPIDPETSPPDAFIAERTYYQDPETVEWYRQLGSSYFLPVSMFYLKQDGVVFSVVVGGALGNHYQAQMDYDDILPFYRLDTRVWE